MSKEQEQDKTSQRVRDQAAQRANSGFYDWSPVFLEALATVPNVTRAAEEAGVGRATVYAHRSSNERFKAAWDDAIETGIDRLEQEMWRRAVEGIDKPIVFQGEITDTYKEFSDTLIITLAKAYRPERFRDRYDVTSRGERLETHVNVYLPDNDRD